MTKLSRHTPLSPNFSVGQVLYVFSNQEKTIIPVQIVIKDRQVIEKLGSDGPEEQITYRVVLPNDKTKLHILSEMQGEIYTSIKDVEDFLSKKMKEQITKLIFQTREKSRAAFGKAAEQTFSITEEPKEELATEMEEFLSSATSDEASSRLSDTSERILETPSDEAQYIVMEDGRRIKARSITLVNRENIG